MYIKNKTIEQNNITFELQPIFTDKNLIARVRAFVDAWFTYRDMINFTEKYNFRRCSFEATNVNFSMSKINIDGLTFHDSDIVVTVYRDGRFIVNCSDLSVIDDLSSRVERILYYEL